MVDDSDHSSALQSGSSLSMSGRSALQCMSVQPGFVLVPSSLAQQCQVPDCLHKHRASERHSSPRRPPGSGASRASAEGVHNDDAAGALHFMTLCGFHVASADCRSCENGMSARASRAECCGLKRQGVRHELAEHGLHPAASV